MTNSDFRALLKQFPKDMDVYAQWEGVYHRITPLDLNVENIGEKEGNVLVIQVEYDLP